jgi:2-polyprenyl-3-methyl-5-hydroxy-6-metoxy-1,4-benzoquinol methylase
MRLPSSENIRATSAADPLKFYYLPLARSFYARRFVDATQLLGRTVHCLLDVGCGSGIFLPELAGCCDGLWACDVHPHLDRVAAMLQAESVGATLIRSSACALPHPVQSFDAIVCMSVLEHIHDLESAVDELFRLLSPGGIAIVGVPVSNLITETILRLSYLSLDASLKDEHVCTHTEIVGALNRRFLEEEALHIPRRVPEWLRLYSTFRFRRPSTG